MSLGAERKAIALARRREELIFRIERQRSQLAGYVEPWREPIRVADKAMAGLQFLRAHPAILAAAAVAALLLGRGSAWRWARRSFVVWRVYRSFRNFVYDLPD